MGTTPQDHTAYWGISADLRAVFYSVIGAELAVKDVQSAPISARADGLAQLLASRAMGFLTEAALTGRLSAAFLPRTSAPEGDTLEDALARAANRGELPPSSAPAPSNEGQRSTTEQEDVLEEALRITKGDRQNQYGPPDQDFQRTAQMWTALKGVPFEAREVAAFMIALKLSRQTHQNKRDNWVDIAGYARCGSKCQNKGAA